MNSQKILNEVEEKLNINNSESKIGLLKSDFFLQKIFENLPKKKLLEIIKYNNNIKKRININIKDYKEFSEIYSSIEIELIPIQGNKYNNFINFDKNADLYFHIYFNDNKEEIKRNYFRKNDNIAKINIIIDYQVKSFNDLFSESYYIESINFKKFYRNNITNMASMFFRCYELKKIYLSNFNTNNVTDMHFMFGSCQSLKKINLSKFNTNKVTNFRNMFDGCSSLKELNLTNFNTNNVTEMSYMFSGCSSLKELNLSNFNTNKVTGMSFMFSRCSSLKEINLSNFNTNNVTEIRFMFSRCSSLKEINLSNFKIKNEIDVSGMFYECSEELKKKAKTQIKNLSDDAFRSIFR